MRGLVSNEMDVPLSADDIWAVYSSPDLPRLIVELQPGVFEKLDIVEGDGRVGTVLHIVLAPGGSGPRSWKEKFIKIDDATRTKVIPMIEGGYLDLGFHFYETSFVIIEKDTNSCIIKNTVTYEVDDKFSSNASSITAVTFWGMAKAIANYAIEKNKKCSQ